MEAVEEQEAREKGKEKPAFALLSSLVTDLIAGAGVGGTGRLCFQAADLTPLCFRSKPTRYAFHSNYGSDGGESILPLFRSRSHPNKSPNLVLRLHSGPQRKFPEGALHYV